MTLFCSAWEHGVNYFDTAEIYGHGIAEKAMGAAFKRLNIPRKDFVVSTKFFKCGQGVNDGMLSRKHLCEGINASLERLQLDYVDVAFAHRYDCVTPIEEVCRAFNWMIDKGKCFYWATSEWTPAQLREAFTCCDRLGLIKPIADQPQYNLIMRKNFEVDLAPIFEKTGYGTTIWSPLAGGLLTGKYNDKAVPADSRLASGKLKKEECEKMLKRYEEAGGGDFYGKLNALANLAKELNCTQAQLVLAWCIVNKDVSTCLIGASKPSQVEENMGALEVAKNWTLETEKKIEAIMENKPESAFNWRTWKPVEPRREVQLQVKH